MVLVYIKKKDASWEKNLTWTKSNRAWLADIVCIGIRVIILFLLIDEDRQSLSGVASLTPRPSGSAPIDSQSSPSGAAAKIAAIMNNNPAPAHCQLMNSHIWWFKEREYINIFAQRISRGEWKQWMGKYENSKNTNGQGQSCLHTVN